MLTQDMRKYRREYYKKNREYLLNYSKWYYTYLKYVNNQIPIEKVLKKPDKPSSVNTFQNEAILDDGLPYVITF